MYPNHVGTAWIATVSLGACLLSRPSPLLTFVLAEDMFICDDCEYKCLAFDDVHTRKHTLVRVVEKVVETVVSTEERLRAVEGKLETVKIRVEKVEDLLSKLLEKGTEGSPDEALAGHDIQAVIGE